MVRNMPLPISVRASAVTLSCALAASVVLCGPVTSSLSAQGLIASPETGWPQWRGPRRDGVSDQRGVLADWPAEGPPLVWAVTGLGMGWSSPIVVGERLYITGDVEDDLYIFAFDLQGNLQWRVRNGASWTGSYPGARATCCYSEGRLYHLNAHGRLVCLDAGSGTELWAVDIIERFDAKNITWAFSECLLVDGRHVFVTPGGSRALMAALEKRTGETVWVTPPLADDRTSYCAPILFEWGGRRVIANTSSAHGFGVDADDGQLLWTVPLKNQFSVNASTPVYHSGAIFFVTPYGEEGRRYRLTLRSGQMAPELDWHAPVDTVTGAGLLVGERLFISGYRKKKWWLEIDWATGEARSELKDLVTGAAVYADGRLICLDERGTVGLIDVGAGGLRLAGKFALVEQRVQDAWAHPVLLDGRLYLRYHDTLYAYDVAGNVR